MTFIDNDQPNLNYRLSEVPALVSSYLLKETELFPAGLKKSSGPERESKRLVYSLNENGELQSGLAEDLEINAPEHVHFDMDGVIVDTECSRQDALEAVASKNREEVLDVLFPKHNISAAMLQDMHVSEIVALLNPSFVKNPAELNDVASQLKTLGEGGFVAFFGGKDRYESFLQMEKALHSRPFAGVVGKSLNDHAKVFTKVATNCSGIEQNAFPTEVFRYVRNQLVGCDIDHPDFCVKEGIRENFILLNQQSIAYAAIVTQTDQKHTLLTLTNGFKLGSDTEITEILGDRLQRVTTVTYDDVEKFGLKAKPNNQPHMFAGAQNVLKEMILGYRQTFWDIELTDSDKEFCAAVAKCEHDNVPELLKVIMTRFSEMDAIKFVNKLPKPHTIITAEDTETGHRAAMGIVYCPDNKASISYEDRTLVSGEIDLSDPTERARLEQQWKDYENKIRKQHSKPDFRIHYAGASMYGFYELLKAAFEPSLTKETYTDTHGLPDMNITLSTKLRRFTTDNSHTITLRFDT